MDEDESYYCESCGIEMSKEEYEAGESYCLLCDAEELLDV